MSEPKAVRRLVTIDDERGKSRALEDGPAPDVRLDPARPGFASTFIWGTDRTPARPTHSPPVGHSLVPPPGGSVCRVVSFPPDATHRAAGEKEARAFFAAMGAPHAHAPSAAHPYMQKASTLDLCLVLEGSITLVLDTGEVHLQTGDAVVQRGTRHAWSNRSDRPCIVAISSHDAVDEHA
jgi:hypothetical protein